MASINWKKRIDDWSGYTESVGGRTATPKLERDFKKIKREVQVLYGRIKKEIKSPAISKACEQILNSIINVDLSDSKNQVKEIKKFIEEVTKGLEGLYSDSRATRDIALNKINNKIIQLEKRKLQNLQGNASLASERNARIDEEIRGLVRQQDKIRDKYLNLGLDQEEQEELALFKSVLVPKFNDVLKKVSPFSGKSFWKEARKMGGNALSIGIGNILGNAALPAAIGQGIKETYKFGKNVFGKNKNYKAAGLQLLRGGLFAAASMTGSSALGMLQSEIGNYAGKKNEARTKREKTKRENSVLLSDLRNRSGNVFKSRYMARFEKGTNCVPQTGMAMLHEGETVIPANKQGSGFQGNALTAPIVAEIKQTNSILSGMLENEKSWFAFDEESARDAELRANKATAQPKKEGFLANALDPLTKKKDGSSNFLGDVMSQGLGTVLGQMFAKSVLPVLGSMLSVAIPIALAAGTGLIVIDAIKGIVTGKSFLNDAARALGLIDTKEEINNNPNNKRVEDQKARDHAVNLNKQRVASGLQELEFDSSGNLVRDKDGKVVKRAIGYSGERAENWKDFGDEDRPVAAKFAKGSNFVPQTGMALLHRGEQVIPAGKEGPGYSNTGLSEEERLTIAIKENTRAILKQTKVETKQLEEDEKAFDEEYGLTEGDLPEGLLSKVGSFLGFTMTGQTPGVAPTPSPNYPGPSSNSAPSGPRRTLPRGVGSLGEGSAAGVKTSADKFAEKYDSLGYAYGSKDARSGAIDCSGFATAIYKDMGSGLSGGSVNQMADAQKGGRFVAGSEGLRGAQPGDLVFVNSGAKASANQGRTAAQPTHVMLFAGRDEQGKPIVWESTGTKGVAKNYMSDRFQKEPMLLGVSKAPQAVRTAMGGGGTAVAQGNASPAGSNVGQITSNTKSAVAGSEGTKTKQKIASLEAAYVAGAGNQQINNSTVVNSGGGTPAPNVTVFTGDSSTYANRLARAY